MLRTRVRELALQQGLNLSQLQRKANIAMGTARRYWYNTADGKANGAALAVVDLRALTAIAVALGVTPLDLLEESDTGALWAASLAA